MTPEPDLVFPPFRLDRAQESLWRGTEQVLLRPKAFAMLHYLVAHAPHLVTQAEVLQAVWGEAYVSQIPRPEGRSLSLASPASSQSC